MAAYQAIYDNAQHLRSRGFSIGEALEQRVGTLGVAAVIGAHDHVERNQQWTLLDDGEFDILDIEYTTKRTPKSILDLFLNEELLGKATGMKNQASAKLVRSETLIRLNSQLTKIRRLIVADHKDFVLKSRDEQKALLKQRRNLVLG